MPQPLRPKTLATRVKDTSYQMRQERRKPVLPGPWVYVGDYLGQDDPGNDPPVTTSQSVPWENGWTWIDPYYVGYRHGLDGDTEFIGTLDTAGATSGTVAFTLPVPYRTAKGYSFITDLDLGSGTFSAARVEVAVNGEVTVYFPLTP